ncbi:MAG: aldehyde dehydrogenase family protein [Bacteroidetes bacterium]|jgi:succinate-semialdehyde dehydrogenase/glutarate-semialdehyde dehydrogenase|nr:aldehyde dehydrogenase family protein [Bacteroidota bacterium]
MDNNTLYKIQNAHLQHEKWKELSFDKRQKYLLQLSNLLRAKKEELGVIITQDMHKPISQAIAEIEKCAGLCEYYAKIGNVLQIEKIKTESEISEVHHDSMGVILGIMPWNYPFWQVLRFAIPTLLAGNAVVMKHASNCTNSGNAIQKLLEEAGFPKDLFQHLEIGHTEVENCIANPLIKGVSITGSEEAGRKIASLAGQNLKKCVLELGGNDAFIVLEDADLEKAAIAAAQARLQNCGQTCVAGKRFIIHKKIYDDFLNLMVNAFQKYSPKDAMDSTTTFAGMAREDLAQELEKQYTVAIENGAEIILPLLRIDQQSFQPGLLKMNENNPIADQELFGPLAMVFLANDNLDALRIANNTSFGLANAVFTQDKDMAIYFANNLESGSVAINQVFKSDVRLPFSGRKNSGFGTELSERAVLEFTSTKTIVGGF